MRCLFFYFEVKLLMRKQELVELTNQEKEESEKNYLFWEGRLLLYQEIERIRSIHFPVQSTVDWMKLIQHWRDKRWLNLFPAIQMSNGKWSCHRCGADQEFIFFTPCGRCGKESCASCRHCLLLGRARSCSMLYQFVREEQDRIIMTQELPPLSIQLTSLQMIASKKIQAYIQNKASTILFWAVTGAGKTETMIPIINQLIQDGKSVLWCTPRQDVVKELAPRLKRFFPIGYVTELYGGSLDAGLLSSLVIATAHQTIRMATRFDLVIVDEADAFPLERNRALESTILRSMRLGGTMILLTATPTDSWIKQMRNGVLPTVLLPKRFHGQLLPCPIWIRERKLWTQIKNQKINPTVQMIINEIKKTNGQALWFVPRLKDVEFVARWLKTQFPDQSNEIEFVSSIDEDRSNKVVLFRKGEIRHLVTTTILERGVTVPRCHVVVLRADHHVFGRASLVQIAGRVGRSLQYQAGKVWFLSNDKTEPICQAIREIQLLNREASKEF